MVSSDGFSYCVKRETTSCIQCLSLQTTYDRREGSHHIIRKLFALPFLPASDIPRAFSKLLQKINSSGTQMADLFTYGKDLWLGSSLWPCEEWIIYRQVVRTNNDLEGWHFSINRNGGRGALSFYGLLGLLQEEGKMEPLTYQQLLSAWSKYDDRDVTCEVFFRTVGDTFRLV